MLGIDCEAEETDHAKGKGGPNRIRQEEDQNEKKDYESYSSDNLFRLFV